MRMRVIPVVLLSIVLGAVGASLAGPGAAGYDPDADPFADLARAKDEASRSGRRILLEVGGEWCGWCHRLEKFLQGNEAVHEALEERFVVVKVNWSPENENESFLSSYPAIAGYPHVFVLDADGTLLHSQNTGDLESGSSYDPEKFLAFLRAWGPPGED